MINNWPDRFGLACGVISAQMGAVATTLTLGGAEPSAAILVAGGVGILTAEVVVRLGLVRSEGNGNGPAGPAAVLA